MRRLRPFAIAIVIWACAPLTTATAQHQLSTADAGIHDATTGQSSDSYAEIEELLALEDAFFSARIGAEPPRLIGLDSEYESLDQWTDPSPTSLHLAPVSLNTETQWSFDIDAIVDLPFDLDTVEHTALLEFLEFYTTEGRSRITRWIARAGQYEDMIRAEARRQGAPEDLIWIAAIESGFQNDARSGPGAVGMWQFMSRTAESRGMRIDGTIDERRDPETSTRFAIDYLLYQFDRFGTWPLAFAAYNAGSGHVRGEILEHNCTDFWAMHDDYEAMYSNARRYALRAMALATIARNAGAFGFDAVVVDSPRSFDVVSVAGGERVSRLADTLNISEEEFRELNPELIGSQTPDNVGNYEIRIPEGSYASFVDDWDRFDRQDADDYESFSLLFGESVEQLAERVGLPERVIRRANDLSSRTVVPYGTELLVPADGREPSSQTPSPEVVLLPAQQFSYPDRTRVFYQVHTMDTLGAVADHFAIPIDELCTWNDIAPTAVLWRGMTLQVYVVADFDLSDTRVAHETDVIALRIGSEEWDAYNASEPEEPRSRRRTYRVQSGDSVGRIARRFDVSDGDIMRWNDLDDDAMIIIGQELVVGR